MRACTSGSCSASHVSLGAVKPASARLPLSATSRSIPSSCSMRVACGWLRPSFQRMAGRSGRRSAPSATSPCIWPDRPIPSAAAASRLRRTASVAVHQSSGSCSDQPGWGMEIGMGCSASSRTAPRSSITTPLAEEVPTSIPINRAAVIGPHPSFCLILDKTT